MIRVLLVDDHRVRAEKRAELIKAAGADVVVADDIWDGVDRARAENFAAIVYAVSNQPGGDNIPLYLRRATSAMLVVYARNELPETKTREFVQYRDKRKFQSDARILASKPSDL